MAHKMIIEIGGSHQASVRVPTKDPRFLSGLRNLLEDEFPELLQECLNDLSAHACGEADWEMLAELEEERA